MDIVSVINKACSKCGFTRERFNDLNLPLDSNRICFIPFFGDIRSLFIFSSLILNKFKQESKASKYLIVCSWPGFECFFPYADEFWSITDTNNIDEFYTKTNSFFNTNKDLFSCYRDLNNYFFEDVFIPDENFYKEFYEFGITDLYLKKYKSVTITLPEVPSSTILGKYFNRDLNNKAGYKLFIYPSMYFHNLKYDNLNKFKVDRAFWVQLINKIIESGIVPVIYKGLFTYDLSEEFNKNCIHIKDNDFSKVLSAMRASGCVLDMFSGISRYAIAARTPFICVEERSKYFKLKEYEIDDLFMSFLPKKYLFTFSNIIENNNLSNLNDNLFNSIIDKVENFLPLLNRDEFPPTNGFTNVISYDVVRNRKLKKMGIKFLKLPKI